ncbi:predicted protein [Thalassiosira pseudonana CCMP1335]|uniref:2-(3-amino-3-carboxypropyl)histidine synthase subunit 1 n=1 Tax=Thalassiosira pseudonana TaxID=35128 RepID=B8BZH1_THAPS|nr:predicted protein [Thalassiosira pseudonana CCMP1335]EED93354.1 predicted protein [Thalassiosira pseudonana CCMP1335]
MSSETVTNNPSTAPPTKRAPRIIRRKKKDSTTNDITSPTNEIPPHIQNNTQLNHIISTTLPQDYEFEIPKTIWRIEKSNAQHVGLQLPEGLLMYASTIGDILVKFATKTTAIKSLSILGDVTYGACCIDDLSARALGCDLLVHYGHSCLVPLTCTVIPCLYVFVEIRVDVQHLVDCVRMTFLEEERVRLLNEVTSSTSSDDSTNIRQVQFQAIVPQAKPLSPGEVLGCTAPSDATDDIDEPASNVEIAKERVMIFLADGRFHLEAAMISNPSLRALRYDPYSKTLTEERYEIVKMKRIRRDAIQSARKTMGIILGTLGRQGNPAILSRVRSLLHSRGIRSIIVLLSEIFPKKLEMLSSTNPDGGGRVCAWVQIACPRLSIDWGHYFCVPVLSPFELFVAFGEVVDTTDEGGYPMDFYSKGGGPWTNYYESNKARKAVSYGV